MSSYALDPSSRWQRLHLPHALQSRQNAAMSFRMTVFSFSGAARRGPRDRFRGFALEQSPIRRWTRGAFNLSFGP
jgi:hypothetical protein